MAMVLVASTSAAHADPFAKPSAPEARAHLDQGNKLYDLRRFDAAADEYKAGALVEPAAIFDYNLGQCYRQLGKYDDAIWFYQRFISRGQPTGKVLDAVNGFIAQMKAEQEKAAMSAKPTEPAPTTPATTPQPAAVVIATPPPSHHTDVIGISLGAVGGVAAGVGIALLWDAHRLNSDADNTTSQMQRDALRSKADSRQLAGTIIGIGGVVLVGTAVIEHYVLRHEPARSNDTASWQVGFSSNGFIVSGQF
jgi:tetratricopeptide (TPR) repeat protein